MSDISSKQDYLDAVDDVDNPKESCSKILDRFVSKSHDTSSAMEVEPASEAIAAILKNEDATERARLLRAICSKASSDVAQQTGYAGDKIETEIKRAVTDTIDFSDNSNALKLPYNQYPLDRYLEENLVKVKKLVNTDANEDPEFSWKFNDGVIVETSNRTPIEQYNFYVELQSATDKQLLNELVSEQVGGDDDVSPDSDFYRQQSLGTPARPWHGSKWHECMQSLIDERCEVVETTGPRTMVLEWLVDEISRSRVTTSIDDAVVAGRMAARIDQSGDDSIDEILVPARDIERELDERGVDVVGLQQEIVARGMDSSRLKGETVSEVVDGEDRQLRYWVLDASHELIPEPEATPDSLEMSHEGREWGDIDA